MGGIAVGEEGSASAWQSVFNLGNVAIGAGVLSFPLAFRLSGVLGGACLCALVASLGYCTLNILVRQSVIHGSVTYQGLVKAALGERASDLMSFAIVMLSFGSCVAYFIIVGDNFGAVLNEYVIAPLQLPKILTARQVPILLSAFIVVLPISLQRSMVSLAPASTIAVVVMTLTTGLMVIRAVAALATGNADHMLDSLKLFRFDKASISAIPIMVFAYACHAPSVPVFHELTSDPALFDCARIQRAATQRRQRQHHQQPHCSPIDSSLQATGTHVSEALSRIQGGLQSDSDSESISISTAPLLPLHTHGAHENEHSAVGVPVEAAVLQQVQRWPGDHEGLRRKLSGMGWVFVATYTECTVLYLSAGISGNLLFPSNAEANILNNFPADDALMQILRFSIGLAVLLHYPINSHLARSALYDLICRSIGVMQQAHVPYSHVVMVSIMYFIACIGTACAVKDLGLVFSVMGGMFSSLVVIMLPGALVVAHARGWSTKDRKIAELGHACADQEFPQMGVGFLLSLPIASEDRLNLQHSDARAVNRSLHAQIGSSLYEYEPFGWMIIVIGVSVLVITMYTTFL